MGICVSTKNPKKSRKVPSKETDPLTETTEYPNTNTSKNQSSSDVKYSKKDKSQKISKKSKKEEKMRSTLRSNSNIQEICAKYKKIGNDFFRAGDYHQAVGNYSSALVSPKNSKKNSKKN